MESLNSITESVAWVDRKMEIRKAINTDVSKGGDVRLLDIDYSTFKKTDEEKQLLYKLRALWRRDMRLKFPGWTKRQRN